MKRPKKIIGMLLAVLMLITAMTAFVVSAGAAGDPEVIPVPEMPKFDRPYKTLAELNFDTATIKELFPQELEIRYEGSRVYVRNIGAAAATLFDNNGTNKLELVDGFWTDEVGDETITYSQVVFTSDPTNRENVVWTAAYQAGRVLYVTICNNADGFEIEFPIDHSTMTVQYGYGDNSYLDTYKNGALETHTVSYSKDEGDVTATYDAEGNLKYCTALDEQTYMYRYYLPNYGWSSSKVMYLPCDAPAGYEDKELDDIAGNKPSLICTHSDYSEATCTSAPTCNVCGITSGKPLPHTWKPLMGICSVCGANVIPEITFPNRPYATLDDIGFDYSEVAEAFRERLEVKYENGKYMIKDIGASKAEVSPGPYFERARMSLVDGWWVCEVDSASYHSEDIYVHFSGERWTFQYKNGERESALHITSTGDSQSTFVYFDDSELVEFFYKAWDRFYRDTYSHGMLESQEVTARVDGVQLAVTYDNSGALTSATVCTDHWVYYDTVDGWWCYVEGNKVACDPPADYTGVDELSAVAPSNINCTHAQCTQADCNEPEICLICAVVKEGSVALGHDIVIDKAVAPTCTKKGLTEGSHCSRCDGMTVAQTPVSASGHDIVIDKAVAPTCTQTGLAEGSHCLVCDTVFVAQQELPALGHEYDNACDSACNVCDTARIPAEHVDADENFACDECGTALPKGGLSAGAVAGIVAGAAVAAGICGFSLFWFVIKKKKLSDLIGLIRK